MDPFVRALVERLLSPGAPLSRNRHFHTFETPEGREALRIARRLRSLLRDWSRASAIAVEAIDRPPGHRVRLSFDSVHASRSTQLSDAEWQILQSFRALEDKSP